MRATTQAMRLSSVAVDDFLHQVCAWVVVVVAGKERDGMHTHRWLGLDLSQQIVAELWCRCWEELIIEAEEEMAFGALERERFERKRDRPR